MVQWKTLSKKVILQGNRFLTVENHTVELPDGRIILDWQWIITPDFVNVVAITEDERFLCFRQTKYAVQGTSLAPVGGYMEPGEDPLKAAKLMIEHIDKKRKALGIDKTRERVLFDMAKRRELDAA